MNLLQVLLGTVGGEAIKILEVLTGAKPSATVSATITSDTVAQLSKGVCDSCPLKSLLRELIAK